MRTGTETRQSLRATPAGTQRFRERFPSLVDHFRRPDTLWWSSLALGHRSGSAGSADELLYRSAVPQVLAGGLNVFCTSLSDRMQYGERTLGAALERAFREGVAARDEVLVVSKGGYLTIDPDRVATRGEARRYLVETYLDSKLVDPAQINLGVHCLAPAFLVDQIRRSLANLRLDCIDYYLLEEPELLLQQAGPDGFRSGLRAAFEALEAEVMAGRIGAYGLATWEGLLQPPSDRRHIALHDLFDWALEVGGADHHLRAIQLPYSLALTEALALPTQWIPPGPRALLEALRDTGTAVLASAPLAQGRLFGRLPRSLRARFPWAQSDAQCALGFVRSTPGVTTAVIGMRDPEHIAENLGCCRAPLLPEAEIRQLFGEGPGAPSGSLG